MREELKDLHLRNAELTLMAIRFIAEHSKNNEHVTWYETIYNLADAMIQSLHENEIHKTTLTGMEDFMKQYAQFLNNKTTNE